MAEETYLEWLDRTFAIIEPQNTWILWRDLLRSFELVKPNETNGVENGANEHPDNVLNGLDDIFDASEANVFGETLFICFKCYNYLLRRIDVVEGQSVEEKLALKRTIDKEFPMLCHF